MFDILGTLIEIFVYLWIAIIGLIPGVFMTMLILTIVGTALTYFKPHRPS